MPTYRYRCGGCGKEFEVWQSITDDPLRTHDDGCGGELVKVLTPAGIVLKGSGFYRTDSRTGAGAPGGGASGDGKDGEKAAASKDGGDTSSSSSGGDTASSGSAPASSSTKP